MLESMQVALATLMEPQVLLFIFAGASLGLFVGAMPGISDLTMVAILLPLTFGLPPELGLSFLMGEIAAVGLADCILAILVSIPGEGPSIVTILDGYPLNRKGQGARAMGAGIFASIYGAFVSVALVLVLIMLIRPIVLAFGSAELVLMIVLGLSFIVALSGRSVVKGLIAGGLGLILSLVGFVARSGIARFTFGSTFFYEGINLAVIALGLFGIAVMMEVVLGGEASIGLSGTMPKLRDILRGVKDVFHHWRIFWMSAPVATIIGVIPGLGRMAASWITYGLAKQISKNPEEFGTGRIEGVIAPETANNSTSAGALLTTLSFGVPGSSVMALFAGALLMVGVIPGPALLHEHLDLVYLLIFGIALANLFAGPITLFGASQIAKLAFVPMDFLFPGLIAVIFVAAFATQQSIMTLIPLLLGGALGVVMKKFDYPLPPLILGIVLGKLFEYYLWNALDFRGPLFFLRPIPLAMIFIIIGLYSLGPLQRAWQRAKKGARI